MKRRKGLEFIAEFSEPDHIVSMIEHDKKIIIASTKCIYELKRDKIIPLNIVRDIPKIGETLKEMIEELKLKSNKNFLGYFPSSQPIEMVKLSPQKIEEGRQIIERMKIKYPLKRDASGRMMKPEREV